MERREVLLAKVFFSDRSESKIRPCIVLSDEHYNSNGFLMIAPITTSTDDFCIPVSEKDAGCPMDINSNARFDSIIKLDTKLVIKKIGKVTPEFHSRLVDRIISLIRKG